MIETVALSEMTKEQQIKHKSVHGLRDTVWQEGSDMWKAFLGNRTWEQVHDDDHRIKPKDFAHFHRIVVPLPAAK